MDIGFNRATADALQRYSGFLNEFRRWDATLEGVQGTYPSQQFADQFAQLTSRYETALQRDKQGSSMIVGGFRDHASTKLWHEYAYGPYGMANNLTTMAKYKIAFGSEVNPRHWGSALDRTVEQLVVAVQLLAKANQGNQAPVPHPGPTPVPMPSPYPAPDPNPYPAPYPAPAPYPQPEPTPYPAPMPMPVPMPNPYPNPGDDLA